ncbi:hypothetical protein M514_06567 [Trichuris suis]|uniref:Receptor ligand binding region domain-containing protein n=1 Tax=Trichuris suis TaxID=68888 RepID=A0A085N6W1_9BILA|nr:hypothetical protein M513_06567 [Trichuris suis]KFD65207.1 hypothetical protein M514_06567 [Trichuris suis]
MQAIHGSDFQDVGQPVESSFDVQSVPRSTRAFLLRRFQWNFIGVLQENCDYLNRRTCVLSVCSFKNGQMAKEGHLMGSRFELSHLMNFSFLTIMLRCGLQDGVATLRNV